MKKVLALVLAVIMVCTMAMAVEVGGATPAGSTTSTYAYSTTVNPGKAIIFDKSDLNVTSSDDDIKAGKVNVAVAFERGADKIASQGWVYTSTGYRYVITTKDAVVAIDGTPDIIISTIKVTLQGVNTPVLNAKFTDTASDGTVKYASTSLAVPSMENHAGFNTMATVAKESNNLKLCLGFDYGYASADIVIAADGLSLTPATFAENILYTVKRAAVANAKSAVTVGKTAATTATPFGYSYTLKAGETVMFTNLGTVPTTTTSAAYKALNKNLLDNDAIIVANSQLENEMMPNKAVTLTYDGAKDNYKMYMVNADGTVVDLGAKFDSNKVLTATAVLTGPVIVTDKALTASNTVNPGTTTNPGTGANDVVGVAAALAVVALVSGAAISLKK